jgi:hypothetical protein
MELRLFGKAVVTMAKWKMTRKEIKWNTPSDDPNWDWTGTFEGTDVKLVLHRRNGTWAFFIGDFPIDAYFKTRELALEALEKHLGIFVPVKAADISTQFKAELTSLLAKYDATLESEDHYSGYAECGEDVRMTVSVPSRYGDDGSRLREGCEIDLGECFKGDAS